ncbi:heterogeneous nuclear ribonucleoprotein Q isoform X1 [Juglans microcarpa x Juglans regia]|uniref:heterogeneous nuclear ribonucleoprotein Q isoform X1 n=2 Tax=Juglans microcarpa x Juglans regia TaxID=2249226 RepID=UPI001B7F24D5|nr:heterogeneous nuclear ribonucleoprotein Q isoform X1 [Juglans microcarpa x Juglans regia]XP_041027916.1 heterogeneous nuclear ribonucleoprotein Q isoform X1 [Juglans microcarpa x Juglans regia]XP_041027917.1 heterogeneous nuclear ribonucleoprotein Q isoform X1 [Juglans microcarpa x Juglans regia]XP_041027918.1 heterogeneous nuclear ribonucleoprotein Q isoform X1 [Juglans microcarpa x Juglans regia]
MPRTRAGAAASHKPDVSEKPTESEEQVDLDGYNDPEETMEEEIEYEEVEEEEEVEEVEEEEEEEEEEVEEEVEGDSGDKEAAKGADAQNGPHGDEEMKVDQAEEENDRKKHAELLALPPHGSEVYLGGISHDAFEEDLRGFCRSIGEVTEVRMMKGKDASGSKGYAFVTFRTKEIASRAIEELNNSELKGKKIKCSTSQAKHRLFIGNVPRNWDDEDLKKAVTDIGPGVISVELLKDPQNSSRNRGFSFIEYYNHACAEYSRLKMSSPTFKLENNAPTVSWADPKNAESSAASQVKAVYVKNLPKDITQDRLKGLFEHHGKITKVVIPPAKAGQEKSRFGFVHFAERSSAMKALKNTEKYEIDGQVLECSLAKPQADQKSSGLPSLQKSTLLPSYPPQVGYSMLGNPYGAVGAGYGAPGFAQPLIYGRGPTPAGMAMMPMLLPDGRIGYVLQQPGMQQPHTPPPQSQSGRSGGRGSLSGGRRSNESSRGRGRYHPY